MGSQLPPPHDNTLNEMQSDEDTDSNKPEKRKKCDESDEDDDDDCSGFATSSELHRFAQVRGIKDLKPRVRSVTSSIDACVREDVPGKDALLRRIDRDAKSLGMLRHLVSVCLNILAEKDPSDTLIVNRTFIQQLFTRISGNELHTRTKELHHPNLDSYLEERKLDDKTLEEIRSFPLRCRDALCGEMITSIQTHISGNFESRATEHLACKLEKRLWVYRDDEYFWTNIPRAALELCKAAGQKTVERALSDIQAFTDKERGKEKEKLRPEWRNVLEDLLPKYRNIFEPLRSTLRPTKSPTKTRRKKKPKKKRKQKRKTEDEKTGDENTKKSPPRKTKTETKVTGREDFLYNVKATHSVVLTILAGFRESDFSMRQRRGEICAEIYERQPAIKPSKTKEGYVQQQHLLRETTIPHSLVRRRDRDD